MIRLCKPTAVPFMNTTRLSAASMASVSVFAPEDRPCPADFVLVEIVVFAFQVALQDLSPYR